MLWRRRGNLESPSSNLEQSRDLILEIRDSKFELPSPLLTLALTLALALTLTLTLTLTDALKASKWFPIGIVLG